MQSFFQTLVSGLSFGAVYALVALGFSLVYRTMGLVNFAHGAVLTLFLQRTKHGAAMQAVAMDHEAATAVTAITSTL